MQSSRLKEFRYTVETSAGSSVAAATATAAGAAARDAAVHAAGCAVGLLRRVEAVDLQDQPMHRSVLWISSLRKSPSKRCVSYRAGDEDAFLAGGRDVGATAGTAGLAAAPAAASRRRRRCRAAAAVAESDAGLIPVVRVRPAVLHAAALRRDHAGELRARPHGELRKHHGLVRRAVRRVLRQATSCDGNALVRLGLRRWCAP